MFSKLSYCALGVITLVYFDRAIVGGFTQESQRSSEQKVIEKNDLICLPASIALRTLSLKAHEMPEKDSVQERNQRDLTTYDKAGPYSLKPSLDVRTRSSVLIAIRRFIWHHWQSRRLGHVVTTYYSKEGEPITYSFFIEADREGNWVVAVEVNKRLVARGGSRQKYLETEKFVADRVERICNSTGSRGIENDTKDATREARFFKLRLIEKGNIRFEM